MNKRLIKARKRLGLSQRDVADALGLHVMRVSDLETGRESAFNLDGQWRAPAVAIAELYGQSCQDLWPPSQKQRREIAIEVRGEAEQSQVSPDELTEVVAPSPLRKLTESALDALSDKERSVLALRFKKPNP